MLLILADDLTGALDTGIQFAKRKIPTGVVLSAETQADGDPPPEVLVINTNTRHSSPAEAGAIVAGCIKRGSPAGQTAAGRGFPPAAVYVYKKTDSTLRGHIGAELEALMNERQVRRLPFVPAYPALGRTTKEGRQYLRGKPIDETEMAADPLNPVKTSFIPAIIGEESAVKVRLVRRGEKIPDEAGEREILVFDGETEDDLKKIAKELFQKNFLGESAGCAGFAEALMEILPFERRADTMPLPSAFFPKGPERLPIFVISGSVNATSLEQVKAGLDSGIPGFAAAGEKLLEPGWFETGEAEDLSAACADALKERGICILGTKMSMGCAAVFADERAVKENRVVRKPRTQGYEVSEQLPLKNAFLKADAVAGATAAEKCRLASQVKLVRQPTGLSNKSNVSGRLGVLVRMVEQKTGPLALAVFGGDTLLGIMENLKHTYIRPLEEISPGVVLSHAEGPEGSSIIITKSGAFGDKDIVQTITNYIRGLIELFRNLQFLNNSTT